MKGEELLKKIDMVEGRLDVIIKRYIVAVNVHNLHIEKVNVFHCECGELISEKRRLEYLSVRSSQAKSLILEKISSIEDSIYEVMRDIAEYKAENSFEESGFWVGEVERQIELWVDTHKINRSKDFVTIPEAVFLYETTICRDLLNRMADSRCSSRAEADMGNGMWLMFHDDKDDLKFYLENYSSFNPVVVSNEKYEYEAWNIFNDRLAGLNK